MVEKCGWLTALCLPVGLQYEKGGSDKLASFSVKKYPQGPLYSATTGGQNQIGGTASQWGWVRSAGATTLGRLWRSWLPEP